jgi:hypothetical protein
MKLRISTPRAIVVAVCTVGAGYGQTNYLVSPIVRPLFRYQRQTGRFSSLRLLAVKPFNSTPDNWVGGTGNWSAGSNWTAGVPTGTSAVTIGNTSTGNVTEDLASASAATLTLLSGNTLSIGAGNLLSVGGTTTINSGGSLYIGNGGNGSRMTSAGSLTNGGYLYIGNPGDTTATSFTVTGTLANTGGFIQVQGGKTSAANGLLNISGAAPGTLTGTYNLEGSVGSASVEFGSGGITSIGDGGSNRGQILLQGSNAYLETGATNSNSALNTLSTIASNGNIQLQYGAKVTTGGALTNSGYLYVDNSGTGGSSLTLGGSLTNPLYLQIGNYDTTSSSTVKVTGTVNDAGGTVQIYGGNTAAANSLLNITGAAPATLTGTYNVQANVGSAAVEFGSGKVTSIGDGGSNSGRVLLSGPNAYFETGATNSDSALTGLATVASNGQLHFQYGASMTTTGALTNSGFLGVDDGGTGGGSLTLGGSLTDSNYLQIGNGGTTSSSTVKVTGTMNNAGGTVYVYGGSGTGGNSLLNITGAAPATLTGSYNIQASAGSAAVEFGSGGITNIGDGSVNSGYVLVSGPNAYMETGATHSNSALKGLTTVNNNGQLHLRYGATVSTTGPVTNNGFVEVDDGGTGASTFTFGGGLTNNNYLQVGNYGITTPSIAKVTGTLVNNSSGSVYVYGGNATGSSALVNVTGAAPGTATGQYQIHGDVGSAAVEWASGGITAIGDGSANSGYVLLQNPNAYLETGATNSNSALKGLTTIASNGQLHLQYGAVLTTTGAVSNSGFLESDDGGAGASSLTIGGGLTNSGYMQVGNNGMSTASTTKVSGALTNTSAGTVSVYGGNATGSNALVKVTGAAPGTATGNYEIHGYVGSAAVEWGSGGITAIGDGSANAGYVLLQGANAYLEKGATNSNSALTGLTTIASNGELELQYGSALAVNGALTSSGNLRVDDGGPGGSTFTAKSALTNNGYMQVGNSGMSSAGTFNAAGAFTNGSAGSVSIYAGNTTAGNAVLNVTGPSITNSGTIQLNGYVADATLKIGANVALSGSGTISLSNIASNLITGSSPSFTLTNGSTIQGSGTISNMGIVNTGTISANQSMPLLILPSNLGLNNQGTLSVSTGDTMQVGTSAGGALTNFSGKTLTGGTYSVGGTMQFGASGTSIVTDAANISLTGAGAQIIDFGGNNILANLATIAGSGSFTLGNSWGTFTTKGNFTNNGTLTVGAGDKFIVNLANSLTNFSGTTLTGGTYKLSGTLQFNGANIVTNAASISLTGTGAKILGKNNVNGLANFAVNASGASFTLGSKYGTFTTAGNFTNNGSLTVTSGDSFVVNGNLTNFAGTTLTGGAYNVSGTLQFNGANIVTNAANITLGSNTAKIVNQGSANAMLGFNTNTASGKFTLSGNAGLTTNGGSFTNAGLFTVSSGSTFTVGGSSVNFTQTAGTTTVDGLLQGSGGGSLNLNGGSLFGAGTLGYAVVDAATITPGDSSTKTGLLAVTGAYSQSAAGALDVTIGGKTAGTQFDQLNVSSIATLNGTLNISLASGFTPAVGNTFDILNASSVTGTFTKVNGLSINSSEHFTVTYNGNDVILTVASGAAGLNSVSLKRPAAEHGRYRPTLAPARPELIHAPAAGRMFRPLDVFSAPVISPQLTGVPNAAAATALSPAINPMAAKNHMRFECGVSLNALRHTSGKQLLKALWAAPDSPDALAIGYMVMTPSR